MKTFKLILQGAYMAGYKQHPLKIIRKLGMKPLKFAGEPMGDCVFFEVENAPADLPDFITESNYKFADKG